MRLNSNADGSFTFMTYYGHFSVIRDSVEQAEVCAFLSYV